MLERRYVCLVVLVGALMVLAVVCDAQDYDDDSYGNQGNNNQGDNDNYGAGYGNDDGYNNNMPNYQQNVDSEGSNNNPNNYSPQGGSEADGDYEGDDGSAAAASSLTPTVVRVRRSTDAATTSVAAPIGASTDQKLKVSESAPKLRVKRHGKYYIGPVYTYVKTDKHANFKWGVKHKVGKKHYG